MYTGVKRVDSSDHRFCCMTQHQQSDAHTQVNDNTSELANTARPMRTSSGTMEQEGWPGTWSGADHEVLS